MAAVQAIRNDPVWNGGDYATPPLAGLRASADLQLIAGLSPLPAQIAYPTAAKAEAYLQSYVDENGQPFPFTVQLFSALKRTGLEEANDKIVQLAGLDQPAASAAVADDGVAQDQDTQQA